MIVMIAIARFGWYSIVGKRNGSGTATPMGTFLGPTDDGNIVFSFDSEPDHFLSAL